MNEEQDVVQPSEEDIKNLKARQAGKDIVNIAGRAGFTYVGGIAGAKAYDTISKTKLGQAGIDKAGDKIASNSLAKNTLSKAQLAIEQAKPALEAATVSGDAEKNKNSNDSSNSLKSSFESENKNIGPSAGIDNTVSKIGKFWPLIALAGQFLLILIIIILLVAVIMSGILFIKDVFKDIDEEFLNFVSGCGWSNNAECDAKSLNNFYEKVNNEYDEYKKDYNIEINRELLIATLTYDNPFLTADTDDEASIDYKKSKKQVDKLLDHMVVKEHFKEHKEDGTLIKVSKAYELTEEEKDVYKIVEGDNYCVDEEYYRQYLEDTFIIKFYFDNKTTEENKIKAKDIVEEIFSRAAFANSLTNTTVQADNYNAQNITVTITDCSGMATLEQVNLSEYLQGVVYMYGGNTTSNEYISYLSIAAKNYLYNINGATVDDMPTNLRIKNCQANQMYCNVSEGCHYMEGTRVDDDTLVSGSDDNGNYAKGPASTDFISTSSKVINEKSTEFLVDNNMLVSTKLNMADSSTILGKLANSDYKTVLTDTYGGVIDTVSLVTIGYPLDLKHNRITSLYGWRLHPIDKVCKHHNGMDIAAPGDANIYSYADGVVTINQYSTSYGYYTVIGHGNYDSSTNKYDYYTLYAHQIRLSTYVNVGSKVVAGQKIGSVGSTGRSTGNHLHLEIYEMNGGTKVRHDPLDYLSGVEFTGDFNVNAKLYLSEAACKADIR